MDEENKWQPIETAPKHGQVCLVVARGVVQYMAVTWLGEFVWSDGVDYGESVFDPFPSEEATHWMPLPDPPRKD